jgi:ferredoxin
MIQIIHLRHKCIGCNACVEAAPTRWIMSKKDGKSYLRKSVRKGDYYILKIPDLEYEENLLAAQNCPVNIIQVREV